MFDDGGRCRGRTRDLLGVNVGERPTEPLIRDGASRSNREPIENQRGFADHLLSTESDGARPYYEPQLRRWEEYRGILQDLPEKEVQDLLCEVVRYFGLFSATSMPLPPTGLPGARNRGADRREVAAEIISLGWQYFLAAARNETRSMHNRWKEAKALAVAIRRDAKDDALKEMMAREQAWIEQQATASRNRPPSSIYFIGAASGPIKIGIAVDPAKRLKSLQTGHHERLGILATCPGGSELEKRYHARFADRRLAGEWFERCPEILAEIESLNA